MTDATRIKLPFDREVARSLRTGDRVLLTGTLVTARDAAHARFAEAVADSTPLPFDPAGRVLYFVGPTPAPPGKPIGSAGPTTASRMDPYSPLLIERGLAGMVGKGRRSDVVKASMLQYGCVYFGAVEGHATLLAACVTHARVIAYEDLGTEAVHELDVVDFPVIVVNDLHGGDQYLSGPAEVEAVVTEIADARSFLFVPGNRPERFDKARACGDIVIVDLEDAVAPGDKPAARSAAREWVGAHGRASVRINPPGTAWFDDDAEAFADIPAVVVLPKADAVSVRGAAAALHPDARIVALLETARGVFDAQQIAAHPSVVRIALGNIDLAATINVDPDDHVALQAVRSALVLASAAAEIAPPIDGVTATFDDASRVLDDAQRAVRMGFGGKLCIHPRQVEPVHRAFAPSAERVEWARRVVSAIGDDGVAVVDGAMIDRPVVMIAHGILHRADAWAAESAHDSAVTGRGVAG